MDLLSELPIEFQHKVFYCVAEHPVAKITKDFPTIELVLAIDEREILQELHWNISTNAGYVAKI